MRKQRGFSGAGWAEERDDGVRLDGKIDGGDDLNLAAVGLGVTFFDLAGFDDGLDRGRRQRELRGSRGDGGRFTDGTIGRAGAGGDEFVHEALPSFFGERVEKMFALGGIHGVDDFLHFEAGTRVEHDVGVVVGKVDDERGGEIDRHFVKESALIIEAGGHEKISGFAWGGGAQLFDQGGPLALLQQILEFLFVGIVHKSTEEPTTFWWMPRRRLQTRFGLCYEIVTREGAAGVPAAYMWL